MDTKKRKGYEPGCAGDDGYARDIPWNIPIPGKQIRHSPVSLDDYEGSQGMHDPEDTSVHDSFADEEDHDDVLRKGPLDRVIRR